MEQQLAAILGAVDPASFEALVSHLMSSANEQRSHAEALFNLGRDRHPDALALKLAHLLHSSSRDEIRAMSAILLRRVLTRDSSSSSSSDTASLSYLWPRLSPASQSSLKSLLLSAVQREDSKTISKKLCDTVAELASSLLPDDAWPELFPFMFQAITSADFPRLQESSLLIFSQLAQYIGDALLPHLSTLHGVFFSSLSHPSSSDVRIAALGATICYCHTIFLSHFTTLFNHAISFPSYSTTSLYYAISFPFYSTTSLYYAISFPFYSTTSPYYDLRDFYY